MDGYVIIGTELDTKQLEQDLKNAKKELSQFQKEEERLLKEKGKVELQLSAYDEEKAKIKANTDEMLKKAETEEQVTNLLNMESIELDELTQKYSKQFTAIDGINDKLKNNQLQQGLINGKIDEANNKLMKAKGYENVKNQLGKISDKTSDVVKKIGKWALAIFSVRSAYMFIRQLSGTLAQYDAQYGANLEYIRYLLAQAIAPVLQFLVSLAYKLLSYINAIAQAWFGVNLFSNASVKNFNKMAGSAKSIEKSLQNAGFDEMNVLSDTSSSGGGAGGGAGGALPSLGIQQMEIPNWMNKLPSILNGVLAMILAIKFGIKGIKAIGIGVAVAGFIELIKDIIEFIKDPSWEGFIKIIGDIAIVVGGLISALTGKWWGLLIALVGAIIKLVVENWDKIKEVLGKIGDWIYSKVIKPVGDFFVNLWNGAKEKAIDFWEGTKAVFSTIGDWIYEKVIKPVGDFFSNMWNGFKEQAISAWDAIKSVFDTVVDYFKTIFTNAWTAVKNVFSTGGKIFDGIKEGIVTAFKAIVNAIINGINKVVSIPFNAINGILNGIRGVNILGAKPFEWIHTINVPQIPRLAVGGIVNMPRKRNISRRCNDRRTRCRTV